MADFINTIDVLGDDAVIDSIIDRSIAEFRDDKISALGRYAFSHCTELTTVDLPNLTLVGNHAFAGCTALSSVNLPLATQVGQYFMHGCASLTKVTLPSATSINDGAFQSCKNLVSVDLPSASVIRIVVFQHCEALTELILRGNTVCKLTGSLANTPFANGTGYIYVPRALVDSYKASTNWPTYATQFRALEDYTVDGTTTGELDETKI